MAMTRLGAGLARRLVSVTASPWSGELAHLARKLRTASPRSLEGSMGDSFASSNRSFHATRGICSPIPPPHAPPFPPTHAPPTRPPHAPPTHKSLLDTSFKELFTKITEHRNTGIVLSGTLLFISGTLTILVCNHLSVEKYIDRKLTEQKQKDDEGNIKWNNEIQDYERLERNRREEFDSNIISSLNNLTSKIDKFENKWAHPHKALHADDLPSRSGISDVGDLPLAVMNKENSTESQVLELKKATAESTGKALKYLEIGDELDEIESKVSSLKASKLSKDCIEEPGKESSSPEGP